MAIAVMYNSADPMCIRFLVLEIKLFF